jgi:hypothetical protein
MSHSTPTPSPPTAPRPAPPPRRHHLRPRRAAGLDQAQGHRPRDRPRAVRGPAVLEPQPAGPDLRPLPCPRAPSGRRGHDVPPSRQPRRRRARAGARRRRRTGRRPRAAGGVVADDVRPAVPSASRIPHDPPWRERVPRARHAPTAHPVPLTATSRPSGARRASMARDGPWRGAGPRGARGRLWPARAARAPAPAPLDPRPFLCLQHRLTSPAPHLTPRSAFTLSVSSSPPPLFFAANRSPAARARPWPART